MSLFKKKIEEQTTATQFVGAIVKETRDSWQGSYASLKSIYKNFIVEDEDIAMFDLALASIALGLQSVKFLFPEVQAERIEKWVLKISLGVEDWGEYAVGEIKSYGETFQKGNQFIGTREAMFNISTRLAYRLLGKNIKSFESTTFEGAISPVLLISINVILKGITDAWDWKTIKDKYILVAGDLPLD